MIMIKRSRTNMPDWVQQIYAELMKPPYFLQKQPDPHPSTSVSTAKQTNNEDTAKAHEVTPRPSPRPAYIAFNQNVSATSKHASSSSKGTVSRVAQPVPLPVLERYPFDVERKESVEGVLKVYSSDGKRYAVKRTTLAMPHVRFIHRALMYAQKQGFTRFSHMTLTKKKAPGVVHDDNVYYATEWIEGQFANFSSSEHVAQTAYALAQFHEATKGFQTDKFAPADAFDLFDMTQQRHRDLRQLLIRAEAKRDRDAFDELFLTLKPQLLDDSSESLQQLQQADCVTFLSENRRRPGLAHLDVIPGNCVYAPDHKVHLIDFELSTFAPRALDIAHLLRRSLQLTRWQGDIAYACFLHFNSVQTMPKAEYQLVHALLQFPYLPWRLAHTRFHYYADSAQVTELERYVEQESRRHEFLDSLSAQVRNLSMSDT